MAYIEFNGVVKEYPAGDSTIRALDGASFTADEGELSVILGQSGAGKTTALNILGGMDTATSGTVVVGGRDITDLNHHDLITYRRNDIGFVFQFYNLIPNLTALENVELASQICADHFDPEQTLDKVGLGDRLDNFPAQLSGGEQQRVAIARAVVGEPSVILADEPTAALDAENGKAIMGILAGIAKNPKRGVLVVTHDPRLVPYADRIVHIEDGNIVSEETRNSRTLREMLERA